MNSVRCKNLSLKYQRFTPSGGKIIGIKKSEFVTKTSADRFEPNFQVLVAVQSHN